MLEGDPKREGWDGILTRDAPPRTATGLLCGPLGFCAARWVLVRPGARPGGSYCGPRWLFNEKLYVKVFFLSSGNLGNP